MKIRSLFSCLVAFALAGTSTLNAGPAGAVLTVNTLDKTISFSGATAATLSYVSDNDISVAVWRAGANFGTLTGEYEMLEANIIADTSVASAISNSFSMYEDGERVLFKVTFSGELASASIYSTGETYSYSSWDAADIAIFESVMGNYSSLSAVGSYPDISISFVGVPEPSTYAAFCGMGVLGLAIYRRRKSA